MACKSCGKKSHIINSRLNFKPTDEMILNKSQDLKGKFIVTIDSREGLVEENVINNNGEVVGYIVRSSNGMKFSILRSEVLQEK